METLESKYTLLDQTDSSRNSTHSEVEPSVQETVEEAHSNMRVFRRDPLKTLLIVLLLIIAISQSIAIAHLSRRPCGQKMLECKQSLAGLVPMKNVMRQQFLPTKYMDFNETESSSAWEDIKAGHGQVSIDPKWAIAQGLPPSMSHPIETEKMVYTIAAYHSLHCLKFLRQHYIALKNGSEIDWEVHHDFHCFDTLRQNIMCTADDNLLHATGHRDAGYGQVVQCKDWDALREWATERSACYHDHLGSSKGHWGHCDNGEDGLPRNSLME